MERYDEIEGDEQDPEDGEEQEQEPEFSEDQRAYLERQAQERETASQAAIRQALDEQDTRHRQELLEFSARVAQQGQQPTAAPAKPDPVDELGPMPEYYDGAEMAAWLQKRDELMAKRIVEQVAQQFQPVVARQSQMLANAQMAQVETAIEKFNPYLKPALSHPDFAARMQQALAEVDPAMYETPQGLAGVAAWVTTQLDHSKTPAPQPQRQGQERQRGDDGKFLAEAQRAALGQIGTPQDAGRGPTGRPTLDPALQQMAAAWGMTPEEWAHHKAHNDAAGPDRIDAYDRLVARRRGGSGRR